MDFAQRHIGPAGADQARMLEAVGYARLDELTEAALPAGIAASQALDLPAPLTEDETLAELRRLAGQNTVATSMIGLGYYGTHTPAVIRRNLLENPAWYTAYTPYQPEISQGRLEALLNFQTMVEDLTGLPVAGASMLDEATAAAEAMTLARRAKGKGSVFLADSDCLPQTLAVLQTRAEPLGIRLVTGTVDGRADRVTAGRRAVRRAAAVSRRQRRDPRPAAADRGGEGARRAGRRRRRPAGADADHAAGRARREHRRRQHAAVRRADGLRRAARRLHLRQRRAQAPAARPARRRLGGRGRRSRPTGSRCRPASSTSAGRRRPATSAPPRCCSR